MGVKGTYLSRLSREISLLGVQIMLFVILFPIADSRSFLNADTGMLNRPFWPTPIPDQDFIRSFGAIRRRPRGGLAGWVSEAEICEANNALRFKQLNTHIDSESGTRIPFRIAYRRFYFDGQAVAKFEVGLVAQNLRKIKLSPQQTRELFYHFLELDVSIPHPLRVSTQCQLVRAGKHLTNLYALSSSKTWQVGEKELPTSVRAIDTDAKEIALRQDSLTELRETLTKRFDKSEFRTLCFDLGVDYDDLPGEGKSAKVRELIRYLEYRNRIPELGEIGKKLRPDISWASASKAPPERSQLQKWWIKACPPLLLVEPGTKDEQVEIPFRGKSVSLKAKPHVLLSHHFVRHNEWNLRLWRIQEQMSPTVIDGKLVKHNREQIRQLRIFLLRLYTEQVCLKQILTNVATKKIVVPPRSEASDLLQHYLNTATRRIARLQSRSFDFSTVEEIARAAEDFVLPGERDAILEALRYIDIRRNVYRKVEHFVNQPALTI